MDRAGEGQLAPSVTRWARMAWIRSPVVRSPLTPEQVAAGRTVGSVCWLPDGRPAWTEASEGRTDVLVDGVRCPVEQAPGHRATLAPTRDGRIVFATADARLAVLSPGGPVQILTPEGISASAPAVAPDGGSVAHVAETDDTCEVWISPLDPESGGAGGTRVSAADFAFDPAWAPDGRALAWHEWDLPSMPWDESRIVVRGREDGPLRTIAGGAGVAVGQPRFAPGGERIAFVCDRTGWMRVWTARPDGRDAHPIAEPDEAGEDAEPTWGPGQRSFAWSPSGDRIVVCRGSRGFGWLDLAEVGDGGRRPIAEGWHRSLDWSGPGIVGVRSSPTEPPTVVTAHPDPGRAGSPGRTPRLGSDTAGRGGTSTRPGPEPIRFPGADGADLHALYWLPSEPRVGPTPLLVHVHGGPTDQARADWWARADFFRDRGWAVLAPNHRGSTGHGRAYTQALSGHWGQLDASDVAAGIRAAAGRGWADPDRIAMIGGSAGGFTALLVCASHPGLVAAAAVRYPVTDLHGLAAATHRFESRYTDTLVGPRAAAAPRWTQRSPLAHAARIRTPLLVLRGDDDAVVPGAQVDALVAAVRAHGTPVEDRVYRGEGHGFRRPETVADELRRTEAFLARHVASRPTSQEHPTHS